jgi:hypothetical protein
MSNYIAVRVWNKPNGMIYNMFNAWHKQMIEYIDDKLYPKNSTILMLSTNLKDRTGKIIYEGDFLQKEFDKSGILWYVHHHDFKWYLLNECDDRKELNKELLEKMFIIGNAYEENTNE